MKTHSHKPASEFPTHLGNFEHIYHETHGLIYGYFLRRTGFDPELAQDLTQETFFRAFRHFSSYRDEGYPYQTYLMTVAHNVLVNHYRRFKSTPVSKLESMQPFMETQSVDDTNEHLEKVDLIRAIEHLAPFEQRLLTLAYVRGMPLKEIARHIAKTVPATKLLLFRIRNKVRNECRMGENSH